MQNKIVNYLKKLSIVTTHPNEDWLKIFALLLVIAIVSLGFNAKFYFSAKSDIEASMEAGANKTAEVNTTEARRIRSVTERYDNRAAVHQGVAESAPTEVADPS